MGRLGGFRLILRFLAPSGAISALRKRTSPFLPSETFEVVDQVGHADFHPAGALDTDGPDKQPYLHRLAVHERGGVG